MNEAQIAVIVFTLLAFALVGLVAWGMFRDSPKDEMSDGDIWVRMEDE